MTHWGRGEVTDSSHIDRINTRLMPKQPTNTSYSSYRSLPRRRPSALARCGNDVWFFIRDACRASSSTDIRDVLCYVRLRTNSFWCYPDRRVGVG